MHPYRMQQLIRQRRKDKVVNVGQRASLYKTIERLHKQGLVAVRETSRDQNWPERTVYELTDAGREVVLGWMHDVLAEPQREFPEFPAALAFMALLTPDDVSRSLERREARLRADVAELEAELAAPPVPRLFLVEDEYRLAMRRTELEWVASLVELIPSSVGLHVSASARSASVDDTSHVVERAAAAGVACMPLAMFAVGDSARSGLVLGYGGIDLDDIDEALARLGAAFAVRSAKIGRRRASGPTAGPSPSEGRRPTEAGRRGGSAASR